MEPVTIAVLIGGGVLTVLLAVVFAELARTRRLLEAAAARLGGRVIPGGFWSNTRMEWTEGAAAAELSYFPGTDKAPPWTRTRFSWTPPGHLRVAPEGVWASIKKFFGAQDLQLGDPGFDPVFLIQGEPEAWARDALSPKLRAHLLALRDLGGATFWTGRGIRLDVGPTGVTLQCSRNLCRKSEHLDEWLRRTRAVQAILCACSAIGVQLLTVREVVEAGRCVVCGDSLGGAVTRCRTCDTAHHAECWKYFGGCAIFGCDPRPAAALDKKKAGKTAE